MAVALLNTDKFAGGADLTDPEGLVAKVNEIITELNEGDAMLTPPTAVAGGKLTLKEGTDGGAHKVTMAAPATLAADRTITVPDANVVLADIATNTAAIAAAVAVTSGGVGNSGKLLEADGNGKLDGRVVSADGTKLDEMLTSKGAAAGAKLVLHEGTDNGVHKATMSAPVVLTQDCAISIPDAATVVLGDIAANAAKIAAIAAENTDLEAGIDVGIFLFPTGTWTGTMQAAGPRIRRTAGAGAADEIWFKAPDDHRTTALRGRKVLGVAFNYEITTEDANDVRFEVYKVTMAAHAAQRTKTLLGGDADGHYDANHDTAVKRGTIANRRAVVTLPTPAYLAVDEQVWVRVFVNDSTGNLAVVDVTAGKLVYAETMNDVA